MWFKSILVTLAVVSYPVSMHWLLTSGQWPVSTLLMALLPFGLLPLNLLTAGRIGWGLLSALGLIMAIASAWSTLLQNPSLIFLLQNITMECLIAWAFGRTLLPGHEPLISQFARRIHGTNYSPAIATYTRQATWAWTLYFVAIGVGSLLLYATAPLTIWSWYVNFFSFVLLGLMFAGEYAVRRWRLRDIQHVSFIESIAPFWDKPAPAQTPADSPP
jgi:uncharacterized membrane protein